jgi:hypothetical protein
MPHSNTPTGKRPENLGFSILEPDKKVLKQNILSAHLGTRILPSTPIDILIENDNLYTLFYERTLRIDFDSAWNWAAIISFQTHKLPDGSIANYAIARPFERK